MSFWYRRNWDTLSSLCQLPLKKSIEVDRVQACQTCDPRPAGKHLQALSSAPLTLCLAGAGAGGPCRVPQPHRPHQSQPSLQVPQCPQMLQPGIDVFFPFVNTSVHLSRNQIYRTQCISEAWGHLWDLAVQWSSLWKSAKCWGER